jgi:starch synthase (maltosyl-transferring)
MRAHAPRPFVTTSEGEHRVEVDPVKARFSTWYELFLRSTGRDGAHGSFKTAAEQLPAIAAMGFDVLYVPPIHPIGRTHRKGKNNALSAEASDPGSPWAIGGEAGGHKSIHPALGTETDFVWFLERARSLGIEVALDLAFQCSPDHPYVKAHPEWFQKMPDGRIQYAENPPKKYEDIFPLFFECDAWQALWAELLSVVQHWCKLGVKIFRVDNPHTKPTAFWHWLIAEVRRNYPETIFLAEAFTRPAPMYELAKIGFQQSYTYFPWRNTKHELESYFKELTHGEAREFFRGNAWPNTPDILTEHLQHGGRAAFIHRFVLAATLSASYGIYGPAYELMDHVPRPGAEEYVDNEKYELKRWDVARAQPFRDLIAIVNHTRRAHPALQRDDTLRFHKTTNHLVIAYSKRHEEDVVLCVVNLDPYHRQSAFVWIAPEDVGLEQPRAFQVHDVLSSARYHWEAGAQNYVDLEPSVMPAHVFVVRRRERRENDFEYFA